MAALPHVQAGPRLGIRIAGSLRRETIVCALALTALAAAVLGWYVAHGGFYWDDWENAATTAFGYEAGFLGPIRLRLFAYEPGLGLLIAFAHVLFGARPELHLAFGVALAVAASACFYVLLRVARLPAMHSAAIAALALLFPWSDSTRLWATGGLNNAAVCLFFVGLALALHELRVPNRRRRVLSVALYAGSILTYDVAGIAALVAGALYFTAAPPRRALKRWRLDVLVVVPVVAGATLASTKHKHGLGYALTHGSEIARQAVELIGQAAVPVAPAWVGLAGAAALVTAAACVARRRVTPVAVRTSIGRWLVVVATALGGVAAAYALFLPADPKYVPFADGLYNRVNLLAGFALAAFVFALIALAADLARAAGLGLRPATALALSLAVAVGVAWGARLGEHQEMWVQAAHAQQRVLGALRRAAPQRPPGGTVFYTFRAPLKVSHGIPVFAVAWDLDGAAKLVFGEPNVRAMPVPAGRRVRCGTREVTAPALDSSAQRAPAAYGRVVFVDVPSGHAFSIRNRRECLKESAVLADRS